MPTSHRFPSTSKSLARKQGCFPPPPGQAVGVYNYEREGRPYAFNHCACPFWLKGQRQKCAPDDVEIATRDHSDQASKTRQFFNTNS